MTSTSGFTAAEARLRGGVRSKVENKHDEDGAKRLIRSARPSKAEAEAEAAAHRRNKDLADISQQSNPNPKIGITKAQT